MFDGPSYELEPDLPTSPLPKLGQPATLAGATNAVCGHDARCHIVAFLPAGGDAENEEQFFVTRTEWTQPARADAASDCDTNLSYDLVVAKKARILATRTLVDAGQLCMHWRDEQITIGPNLFVWRDSGYGAPVTKEDYERWLASPPYRIELSPLRVNGCAPPPRVLRGALVIHSLG